MLLRRIVPSGRLDSGPPVKKDGPLSLDLALVIAPDGRQIFGTDISQVRTNTFVPKSIPGGSALDNQSTAYWSSTTNTASLIAKNNTKFSVCFTFQLNALAQANKYIAQTKDGSASQAAVIFGYVANSVEIYSVGFTGTDPRTGSQIVVSDLAPHTVCYSYDGATWSGALDGKIIFSVARTFNLNFTANACTLFSAIGGANVFNGKIQQWATWGRGLSLEQMALVTRAPWSIYEDSVREILIAAGGGGGANWLTSGYWRNRNYGAE